MRRHAGHSPDALLLGGWLTTVDGLPVPLPPMQIRQGGGAQLVDEPFPPQLLTTSRCCVRSGSTSGCYDVQSPGKRRP
jgi:hypothetical protein